MNLNRLVAILRTKGFSQIKGTMHKGMALCLTFSTMDGAGDVIDITFSDSNIDFSFFSALHGSSNIKMENVSEDVFYEWFNKTL